MFHTAFKRVYTLYNPLASASLPLINGLTRRQLLRAGAVERQVCLGGVALNYYQRTPRNPPAQPHAPVLLVHGLADSALTWAFVLGPLARDRTVYAVDLPGYGTSGLPAGRSYATLDEMRDLLVAFIRDIIGVPALVAGNSLGGWLAIKQAWSAPEQVRGIVLLDAGGAPLAGRPSWEPFLESIAVPDLKATRRVVRQLFGIAGLPMALLGQHGIQSLFQRQVVREFVAVVQEDEFLRPEELRGLPVPAALVWGLADRFLPEGSRQFFQDNLPGAPTLLLRRCGHLPQRERPLEVVRFIREFANQVDLMTIA